MSCAGCEHCRRESWPKDRDALRCFAPGERKGRVVMLIPAGSDAGAYDTAPPSWCPERGKEEG